jgi:hypothetical protein
MQNVVYTQATAAVMVVNTDELQYSARRIAHVSTVAEVYFTQCGSCSKYLK